MPAKISTEDLLNDILNVYKINNKVNYIIYKQYGKYTTTSITSHFGSIENACNILKIPYISDKPFYSKQEILDDVKKVFDETNNTTRENYLKYGSYSRAPIKRYFGTWNNLLKELNISLNMRKQPDIKKDEIIKEMLSLYNKYGYLTAEIQRTESTYSQSTIESVFGSFNNMLLELNIPFNSSGKRVDDNKLKKQILDLYNKYGYVSYKLIIDNNILTYQGIKYKFKTTDNLLSFIGLTNKDFYIYKDTSKFEPFINNILNEQAEHEKTFDWLINPYTNQHFRIDLFYPKYNLAIEIDGREHFKVINGELVLYKKRDLIKQDMILNHNIKLIRIRWYYDNETILNLLNQVIST